MQKRILTLLDSLEVRNEITAYSIELALRLRAKLHFLMLLRSDSLPHNQEGEVTAMTLEDIFREEERIMERCIEKIRRAKVEVYGTIRQGDPASELLKYLAESQPFQTIIWGGNERLLRYKRIPVRTHWLERIRKTLECPLVVPSLKGTQE